MPQKAEPRQRPITGVSGGGKIDGLYVGRLRLTSSEISLTGYSCQSGGKLIAMRKVPILSMLNPEPGASGG
jgi:hypothetical protein